ncbi:MAG: hypothetical protein PHX83_07765 [Acidobacteriia bacterium]|nr:hypothetical protein [Terriglobia bacterium]
MKFIPWVFRLSVLIISMLPVSIADAALIPSSDGQTVYDTNLKVTWLANANLAATQTFGVRNINANGSMNYAKALEWVAALNAFDGGAGYLGHNNWTIPTIPTTDPTCGSTGPNGNSFGFACMNSTMGSLFYRSLGLQFPNTAVPVPNTAVGPFSNFQPYLYWTGQLDTNSPGSGYHTFSFNTGWAGSNVDHHYMYVLPMIKGQAPGTTYTASGTGTLQVSADGQTVYDPVANVTWLANADLAKTQAFGLCVGSGGTQCINPDGSMTQTIAQNWIQAMNAFNGGVGYLNHTNWQLAPDDQTCGGFGSGGVGCSASSPLGELFYGQLKLSAGSSVVATPNTNVGPFNNIQPYLYWSCGAPDSQSPCQTPPAPNFEWSFSFGNGFEGTDLVGNDLYVMVYYPNTLEQVLPANLGSTNTSNGAGALAVSYGQVTSTTSTDPVTLAIFGFTQNNILVTEAGIPASGTTPSARMFVDYDQAGGRNSGVALVNPGSTLLSVNVTLTSQRGDITTACASQQIPAQGHLALFVNQLGCPSLTNSFLGTITFSAANPFAAVNLRIANNAHGEQIFSALPVVDLTVTPPSSGNLIFSQIVDGAGTPTQILLMNTTASPITGTIAFADDNGNPIPLDFGGGLQPALNYALQPNGMQKFSTTGLGSLKVAYAVVTSTGGALPSGAAVFASNSSLGGLASQAGVLNAPKTTAARVYIERASSPLLRDTGIAVVNANGPSSPATVTFNLVSFNGSYNQSTTVNLPANGHLAKFIEQIFSSVSPPVPTNFQGVLNITSNVPLSTVTLRLTANQRGDNLFSTLPVADLNNPPVGALLIPQIVNGGGFTTQIISINTSTNGGTVNILFLNDSGQVTVVTFN